MTTPWAQWRAIATVRCGWPPSEFWNATPHDLLAALDGLMGNTAHGLTPDTLTILDQLRKQQP
jgi:hypothetical protein